VQAGEDTLTDADADADADAADEDGGVVEADVAADRVGVRSDPVAWPPHPVAAAATTSPVTRSARRMTAEPSETGRFGRVPIRSAVDDPSAVENRSRPHS
jgi:hypothetical protein